MIDLKNDSTGFGNKDKITLFVIKHANETIILINDHNLYYFHHNVISSSKILFESSTFCQ